METSSRSRARALALLACCASLFGLLGCAAAAPQSGKASSVTVARLYPLRPGSVWTYDVDTGEGLPVLAITRVLSANGEQIEVSSGGDSLHYQLRPDGLVRSDTNTYLLHAPIEKGAQWDGLEGVRAEITSVEDAPSRRLATSRTASRCSRAAAGAGKRVRTVFCPTWDRSRSSRACT